MSSGPGTALPGRATAAAPHATPRLSAVTGPSPVVRALSTPASRQSPAPTVERGSVTVALAWWTTSGSTHRAPSAPRLTTTTPIPPAISSRAESTTALRVGSSRPVRSESSSRLGFISQGLAATAAASGAPDVSTATLPGCRAIIPARNASSVPGGRLPHRTTGPVAPPTAFPSRSTSSGDNSGPGSFTLVVPPVGSTMAMFVRVVPAMGTASKGTLAFCSRRASSSPSGPPNGSTARAGWPLRIRAWATFTPLPPGSMRLLAARFTSPGSRFSTSTVRSMLGFGVRVTIMRGPPPCLRCRVPRWFRRRGGNR